MEKKQTAVEWLSEHLCNEMNFDYWKAVEKAKQMEKEQIIEAHGVRQIQGIEDGRNFWQQITGEKYYRETFKEIT